MCGITIRHFIHVSYLGFLFLVLHVGIRVLIEFAYLLMVLIVPDDDLFMSKYSEASGNARAFVWKGLLATLTT